MTKNGSESQSKKPATCNEQCETTAPLTQLEKDAKCYIVASLQASRCCHHIPLWDSLSDAWRMDRDICLAAVANRWTSLSEIGVEFSSNKTFLKDLLGLNGSLWDEILPRAPGDVSLALDAVKYLCEPPTNNYPDGPEFWDEGYENQEAWAREYFRLKGILIDCRDLQESQEFWNLLLDTCVDENVALMFEQYCPDRFLQSSDFMMKFCGTVDWDLIRGHTRLRPELLDDEDFLRRLIVTWPCVLQSVAKATQLKIADVMKRTIADPQNELTDGSSWIASEFWDDEDFIRIFVRAGGIPFKYSKTWCSQPDLVLQVLESCPDCTKCTSTYFSLKKQFKHISRALRHDKVFMRKAIAMQPTLFLWTTGRLFDDDDLFLLFAAGASEHNLAVFLHGCRKKKRPGPARVQDAQEKLKLLEAMEATVERTLLNPALDHDAPLSILQQGGDVYCKLLRDVLGLPEDEEAYQILRQACKKFEESKTFQEHLIA